MTEISDRRSVALHEAGHAVMQYLYGVYNDGYLRRFKSVTIVATDDYEGLTQVHEGRWAVGLDPLDLDYSDYGSWSSLVRRRVEHQLMVLMAGSVVEEMFGTRDAENTIPWTMRDGETVDVYVGSSSDDFRRASDLASLVGGSIETQEAYMNWLYLRALDFLTSVRPEIECLADALEKNGTLSYRKAVKAMGPQPI